MTLPSFVDGVNPSEFFATITPSDSAVLSPPPRAILIGPTGGDLVVMDSSGDQTTIPVQAYQQLPIRPARVMATGTTASPITALY